jgi:hypothetical protein
MERFLKIVALSTAVTALVLLAVFGPILWVFIPLLPAGIIFLLAVYSEKQRSRRRGVPPEAGNDRRKAA